jgi:hypothetical protein
MPMRRRIAMACLAVALGAGFLAAPAGADPAFGPGNSGSSGNQKCHPPGQTVDTPGCK